MSRVPDGMSLARTFSLFAIALIGLKPTGVMAASTVDNTSAASRSTQLIIDPTATNYTLLTAIPYGICKLHQAAQGDYSSIPFLFADEQGTILLQLKAIDQDIPSQELVLECSDQAGATTREAIQLSVGHTPTPNVSTTTNSFAQLWKAQHASWPHRPPLTGDPSTLTPSQLLQQGYPPRPDPTKDPAFYAKWLHDVAQEGIEVPSTSLPNPMRSHQTYGLEIKGAQQGPPRQGGATQDLYEYSGVWSGAVVTGDPQGYYLTAGSWIVPSIRGWEDYFLDAASFWVGLDGYMLNDLMQTGTEQVTYSVPGILTISYYDGWAEYVPDQEQVQPNFPVIPGYRIDAYVVDASGDSAVCNMFEYDPSGNLFAHAWTNLPRPSGTTFYGATAEWITERPNYGANTHLSKFGSASFSSAQYYEATSNTWHYYNEPSRPGTLHWLTLSNLYSGEDLSTPAPVPGTWDQLIFTWGGYN
jgi:hypothetical protein